MLNLIRAGVIVLIVGGLLIGCEDDETTPEIDHPLTGVYTLTELTINVEVTTSRDTTLAFASPQDGVDSVQIPAGTHFILEPEHYTDADTDPIGGTVTLRNDLSGTLSGNLPVNWGTGCFPSILISTLTSDGTWSADTTSGVFTLDLVVDALDIDGSFSLYDDYLEVIYTDLLTTDERTISSVSYMGGAVDIVPACLPVSTTTERILTLIYD